MKILRIIILLIFPLYLISCSSQKKIQPHYLDKAVNDTTLKGQIILPNLLIQKSDLLAISIYSVSTDPTVDLPYNLPVTTQASGFLVDLNGDISYPRLGTIHAEGLTKQQLADTIRKRLTQPVELLRNPTVVIRFLNYRINVLGQVAREGTLTIPGERVTILEAVAMAGGITDFGKKENVKIIREKDGNVEVGFIDLSSDSLFYSPYYHLAQNDVVIVAPTKQKQKMQEESQALQRVSFALGIVTTAVLIYNIFK